MRVGRRKNVYDVEMLRTEAFKSAKRTRTRAFRSLFRALRIDVVDRYKLSVRYAAKGGGVKNADVARANESDAIKTGH
jgi:hypothetical protein